MRGIKVDGGSLIFILSLVYCASENLLIPILGSWYEWYLSCCAAIGLPSDLNPEVCVRDCQQRWHSKSVSSWGAAGIAKIINPVVAKVSQRVAWWCTKRSGMWYQPVWNFLIVFLYVCLED